MRKASLIAMGVACVAGLLGSVGQALAHPHVWVSVRTELVMDGSMVSAIRHHWLFDDAFSAFATQGLDENGDGILSREELQPLAKVNVESLSDYDYFSDLYVKSASDDEDLAFSDPSDYWLTMEKGQLELHFTLPVVKQLDAKAELLLDVYDPSLFVDFSFAKDKSVTLVDGGNDGGKGCSFEVKKPEALDEATMNLLSQIPASQRDLPEDLMKMTATLANQVSLTCK
ncbi:MAG: DUF1007 family protein [Cohaesibacter sp.]|nr:DUF1007 family protein [Cohaesibacter sp.]